MFKLKNTKRLCLLVAGISLFLAVLMPVNALAVSTCQDKTVIPAQEINSGQEAKFCENRGGFTDCKEVDVNKDNCRIVSHLLNFINIFSAVVGIVSVIMIAVWGIQYTIARDNPQMVAQARLRLLQTVLALVAYLFVYAFLQWIVPGGVF